MKFLSSQRVFIAICGLLSVISCQALSDIPTTLKTEPKVLLSTTLGPTIQNEATAAWLTSLTDLHAVWPELDLSKPLQGTDLALEEFDFATNGLLLISMGEMPTGGYSLALQPEETEWINGTAQIVVRWVKPERGRMVPQMITRPCLLVQMRKGSFKQIEVIDDKGALRALLSI